MSLMILPGRTSKTGSGDLLSDTLVYTSWYPEPFLFNDIASLTQPKEGELDGDFTHISERHITCTLPALSILVAAILLVGAVSALYLVQSNLKRLVLIGGFTVFFALVVGVLTSARRGEVFASTAA